MRSISKKKLKFMKKGNKITLLLINDNYKQVGEYESDLVPIIGDTISILFEGKLLFATVKKRTININDSFDFNQVVLFVEKTILI